MVSASAECSGRRSGVPIMARYRKWDLRGWSDRKFRELSKLPPSGQSLWLYLVLGPQTSNIPGLFEGSQVAMAEKLEWSLEDFRRCWDEIEAKGMAKADWRARLIWLPRAPEYNRPESPNVVISWATTYDELPECDLKDEALQALKVFAEDLGQSFEQAFHRAFHKDLPKTMANQEQEQEQEQNQDMSRPGGTVGGINGHAPDPVAMVFQHWQTEHKHPRSKLDTKRRKLINARLKEGHSVEDLKSAITGYLHSPHHQGENETKTVYDDIELMMRDTKHVEMGLGYLNRASGKPTSKPQPRFT